MQISNKNKKFRIINLFINAVGSSVDDGVSVFVTKEEFSNIYREQIKLYGNNEDGAYTVCITETNGDIYLI